MKFSKQVLALAVGAAVSLGAAHSFASVVPAVFNTGVDGSNVLLAGGVTDTHFDFGVPPGTPGSNPVVSSPINGSWVADTSTAQWISKTADQSGSGDLGSTYYYNEQFNLSNYITNDAVDDPIDISGKWAAANPGGGNEILLNGNVIITTINQGVDSVLTSFDINSGTVGATFNSGVNTLTFLASTFQPPDGGPGGPEGVMVDNLAITATLSPDPLPEPATLGILALGAAGLFGRRKRA